ncbi:MAG: hypothetical protein SPL80_00190 [Bacilli bacterium]|nr:hypothetical protein [Bacilli bacterium]
MMCGGALDISSIDEGGTRVRIIIPYFSNNEAELSSESSLRAE